jgi:predicted signal transduction protein with EAL and GGDEF domain
VRWFHPVRGAFRRGVYSGSRENGPDKRPRRVGAENRLRRGGQLVIAAQGLGKRVADSVDEQLADRCDCQRIEKTGLDPHRLDLEITESDVFNENTRS